MDQDAITDSMAADSTVQSDSTIAWPRWGPASLLVAMAVAILLLFVVKYFL
ncbi:hypothetical protein SAMN05216559_0965 [Halomicrobium zhouii]|uniref:Uncharacterized protein n=1 Tax=Halomicrobium zhouii TaxID=767519 RepID=A0A1I6KKN5_9EURY|nr:hypothetical protein [Halomicrobium zhouii]SFR91761.1 hypothetical protein SAMN05216559_0965 [Halomicrobium zhouii]